MNHYYPDDDSYQTIVRQYEGQGNSSNKFECAGNVLISSETINEVTSIARTGYINHLGDVDHYIFDVSETGTYTIRILTDTEYNIKLKYADVTNLTVGGSPNYSTTYMTSSNCQTSFNVSMTAGRRYCLRIFSETDILYDANRYYVLVIT